MDKSRKDFLHIVNHFFGNKAPSPEAARIQTANFLGTISFIF